MSKEIKINKKQFDRLLKSLKSIESKLETLIILQKAVTPKPKLGDEQKKILQLCDKKHTIEDIAKETGKTTNNVKSTLSKLRKKGLIKSVKLKDKVVYERI